MQTSVDSHARRLPGVAWGEMRGDGMAGIRADAVAGVAAGVRARGMSMAEFRRCLSNHTMLVTATLCACIVTGCGDGRGVSIGRGSQRDATLSPGVDAARALLPLERIEPKPDRPQRPEELGAVSERARRQIVKARAFQEKQRFTEAALELERALRYDPDHPDIHRALALLHWQAGNVERAKSQSARAIEANPDSAAAHYVAGRCYLLADDPEAATLSFRTALICTDLDDDAETAALCHYYLAGLLAERGYLTAALSQYEAFETRAAAVPSDSTAGRTELATIPAVGSGSAADAKSSVLERLGRYAEAAELLASAVFAEPDDVPLAVRHARLLVQAGLLDRALDAARAIRSNDEAVISLLSDIHERSGRPDRIVDDLRLRLSRSPDDSGLVLNLVEILHRFDRQEDARHELERHLDLHPDDRVVRVRLIDALVARSLWRDAFDVGVDGARLDPDIDRLGELEAALSSLAADERARAALLDPSSEGDDDAVSAYLRGSLAVAAGQTDRADTLFRNSLERDATFVPARVALAKSLLKTYRYEEALTVAGRLEENRPEDVELERLLGRIYDLLDDTGNAELHYRAVIQSDRSDAEAMLALARVYRRSNRGLLAQRQLRVILDRDPSNEVARERLAKSLWRDKPDEAVQEYEELRRITKSPTTAARCTIRIDPTLRIDPVGRRRVLMEAIGAGAAPDAEAWLAVARTYSGHEQRETRSAYLAALEIDPSSEEATLGLIQTEQWLLDFESAAARLDGLVRRRPNRHPWRWHLIHLYTVVNDFDAALTMARDLESRAGLDDDVRRDYRISMLETLRIAGRRDELLTNLETWAAADPDQWEWSVLLATEYQRNERPARAVSVYERLHEAQPEEAGIRQGLVDALNQAGRADRAAQYALDWLDDDPQRDAAVALLATLLAESDRLEDALELVSDRLLHTNRRRWFQDFLITRLGAAERYDESIEFTEALIDEVKSIARSGPKVGRPGWREAISDDELIRQPDEPYEPAPLHDRLENLRLRLAAQLIGAEQFREAERRLEDWLEATSDPDARARYLRYIAISQQARGDDTAAAAILERAIVLQPENTTLNNDLAYTWIDDGIRLDDAEPLIRFAVGRARLQAAYLDTYGWLLYKKGAFADARRWLLRANRARGGEDPVILDHLGDACWRLGLGGEAIEHWAEAVRLVNDRDEDELANDDERRVRATTQKKVEEGEAGREPVVAPLGRQGPDGYHDPVEDQ